MNQPVVPAQARGFVRLIAVVAAITAVVCGAVLAFATVADPQSWVAAGIVASGVGLLLLLI